MQRRHKTFFAAAAVSLALSVTVMTPPAVALEDAILAIVNDELVTLRDLREYVKATYAAMVAEGKSQEEIDQVMLDLEINGLKKLVEDKLLLSKANDMGLAVKDRIVDQKIESLIERYPSEQAFNDALVKNGATMTDVENKIRDQLKIAFVIENQIKSKIYVNPAEVTDFYQQNIDKFMQKERINVESIFIPFDEDKEAAAKDAEVARIMIENGMEFSMVAEKYSKASSLGMVERGQLLPELEKVVFHLKEGEVSDVFEVDTGFYLFKVTQKFTANLAPLEDVENVITQQIYNTKFRERYLAWMEELKQDAYIEIKQ
ncbi:MAG: peptidyl-prolyl cis-trans isomerase [Candidatus Omnitrophica bacterium]|nr:peptidyl-prolyl cis-trans isomerase [Candidatus Omnitrophota bacterium]